MSLRDQILAELEAADPDYPGFWEPVVDRILAQVEIAVQLGEIRCGRYHVDDMLKAHEAHKANPNRRLGTHEIGQMLFPVEPMPEGAKLLYDGDPDVTALIVGDEEEVADDSEDTP